MLDSCPGRSPGGPEVRGKASDLPCTFVGGNLCIGRARGVTDSLRRVAGGMAGVTRDMSGRRSVAGGTSGGTGGRPIGISSGSMSHERGLARFATRESPARPGASRLDRLTRTNVLRMPDLEAREHAFGAVCGPERQQLMIFLGELHIPPQLSSVALPQGPSPIHCSTLARVASTPRRPHSEGTK